MQSKFIAKIHVNMTQQQFTLIWSGKDAASMPKGPFLCSTGNGKGGKFNCDDLIISNTEGTNCTPKGTFHIRAKAEYLPSYKGAKKVSFFADYKRGIAFHYWRYVPRWPQSHGCVRVKQLEIATMIHEYSVINETIVVVDGKWLLKKIV